MDVRPAQAQPGPGLSLSGPRQCNPGRQAPRGATVPCLALRTALGLSYDFLGLAALCNAVTLTGLAGCWGGGLYLLLVAENMAGLLAAGLLLALGWAWLGAVSAGICELWKQCLECREGSLWDFGRGMVEHGVSGAACGLCLGLAMTGPLAAAWLYAVGGMPLPYGAAAVLAGMALTAAGAAMAVSLWLWPVMVYRAGPWRLRLRLAAALAATRPGLTLALVALALAMTVPVAVLVVPVVIVWSWAQALALFMAAYAWMIREQERDAGPFPAPDDPLWAEFASRTIRDFLFPWKE